MIRYRAQPPARWRTGRDHPCVVSVEKHGRVQSRTPILSPHRSILALDPSANLQPVTPAKYISSLTRNEGFFPYTNQDRQTVVWLSLASGSVVVGCRPPSLRRQRNRGIGKAECVPRPHLQLTAFGSFPELIHHKCAAMDRNIQPPVPRSHLQY